MTRPTRVGVRARLRAAFAVPLLLAGVAWLHACVIEERPFNEQLAACDEYCREAASKCTGAFALYENDAQCLAVCAQIPLGSVDEPVGSNTLRCRLNRLHAGGFEEGTDCPAAGPGGDGTCGTDCESFCTFRRQACGELQPNKSDIARADLCLTSCEGLADPPGFALEENLAADTLQCRLIQLARTFENPESASVGCVQSQLAPENPTLVESVCSDDENLDIDVDRQKYCELVQVSCTGPYQVYDDVQQCLDASRSFERGVHGDIDLNTLRCRRYHAYAALDVPSVHCAHAGPTGDGHCANPPDLQTGNCESHCRILEQACPERFAGEPDALGSCIADCRGLPDARRDGFTAEPRYATTVEPEAGTLKCRTLNALRALGTSDADALCAAAFGDQGSACQ